MSTAIATGLALGYAADAVLGDPRHGHPVALLGAVAARLERITWVDRRDAGAVHVGLLVAGVVGTTAATRRLVASRPVAEALLTAVATWVALGGTSLCRWLARQGVRVARSRQHGLPIVPPGGAPTPSPLLLSSS